jgi:hypothetical protein
MKKVRRKRENMLFNLVEKYLMRPKRLREAIEAVVHENDELLRILSQYEEEGPTNLTWSEGDRWYGWTYNSNAKRYYFDDIGNESLMGLWEDQWLREADEFDPERKINEFAVEQIAIAKQTGEVPF